MSYHVTSCHDTETNVWLLLPSYTIPLKWFTCCHLVILLFWRYADKLTANSATEAIFLWLLLLSVWQANSSEVWLQMVLDYRTDTSQKLENNSADNARLNDVIWYVLRLVAETEVTNVTTVCIGNIAQVPLLLWNSFIHPACAHCLLSLWTAIAFVLLLLHSF
jgi:hypothetical protein